MTEKEIIDMNKEFREAIKRAAKSHKYSDKCGCMMCQIDRAVIEAVTK